MIYNIIIMSCKDFMYFGDAIIFHVIYTTWFFLGRIIPLPTEKYASNLAELKLVRPWNLVSKYILDEEMVLREYNSLTHQFWNQLIG